MARERRQGWMAMGMDRGDAIRETAIVYGRGGGRSLELDVLRPRDLAGAPRPLVVWVHGGGWHTGTRDDPPNDPLVAHGFVTASISYRLSGEAIFPAQIHDVKAAIRFLRAKAARWNVDPDRIGVWGHSAGGHLAMLVALTPDHATLEGTGGHGGISSAVRAVVALSAPTDLVTPWTAMTDLPLHPEWGAVARMLGGDPADPAVRDRSRLASPVAYVHGETPPALVVHGERDDLVPVTHGRSLVAQLREAGADTRLIELPADGHDILSVFGADRTGRTATMGQIVAFFDGVLGPVSPTG